MAKQNNTADVEFIKALAELLHENGLTELEVKREYGDADRLNVRVSRMQQVVQTTVQAPATPSAAAPAAPAVAAPTDSDPVNLAGAVKSPMVGTVYMASEPGSDPFVKVGDKVSEGDTLLIIEAMKTMNQIPAPHSGTIKRILASDGTAVEFGAPLMIIE